MAGKDLDLMGEGADAAVAGLKEQAFASHGCRKVYGTAVFGGLYGAGSAFRLIPRASDKWEEKVLHNFGKGKDGANPYSGVIFDQTHNVYGTTASGGNYRVGMCRKSGGCGIVFEITPRARPQ